MAKKPHHDTEADSHQGGRKSAGGASTNSVDFRKKGSFGDGVPDVLQSLTSSSSFVIQVGTLPKLLDKGRSSTSIWFCA